MNVVHCKKAKYDVYIGRPSKWGNPFEIGKDGSRETVINKYRLWLWKELKAGKVTKEEILELEGKTLGCWCAPLACHGDVLVNAVKFLKGE
jgi:hypothetical protein